MHTGYFIFTQNIHEFHQPELTTAPQPNFGYECIAKCMLGLLIGRVELTKLEYLEGWGVAHYPNTPQYTGVLLCNCNLYKYF